MRVFPIILVPENIEKILIEIESEIQKINQIPLHKPPVFQSRRSLPKPKRVWADVVFIVMTIVFFGFALATKKPILFIIYLALITVIRLIDAPGKFIPQIVPFFKVKKSVNSMNKAAVLSRIEYLRTRIYRIFAQSFAGNRSRTEAQIGYSEGYFKKYLEQYFPNCIFDQIEFPIDGGDFPYSADFIYRDDDGIKIDIEVDEPYSYKNPQPIHFLDNSKDSKRNKYFLDQGWIVIRFAEEQVVRYPRECCKVVAQVISKINGKPYFEKFPGVGSLKKVPIWSKESAMKMLNHKYRDEYTYIIKSTLNDIEEDEVQYSQFSSKNGVRS